MVEILWLVSLEIPDQVNEKMICKSITEVFDMLSEHNEADATEWSRLTFQNKLSHKWMDKSTVEPITYYKKGGK
jgi:hypothetical protein|tara:strand:- start:286 stop:507 length:222 start_codon:yes stop_codon:yes gene_type:complete